MFSTNFNDIILDTILRVIVSPSIFRTGPTIDYKKWL